MNDIEDLKEYINILDIKNRNLSKTLRLIMEKLTELLDEDQFKSIEDLVLESGVEPLSAKVAELEAKLKVAVEALKFYIDRKNWHKDSQEYGNYEMSDFNIIYNDFYEQNQQTRYAGNKAAEALKLIGGE